MKPGENPALSRNGKVRSLLTGFFQRSNHEVSEAEIRRMSKHTLVHLIIRMFFCWLITTPAKAYEVIVEATPISSEQLEPSPSRFVISSEEIRKQNASTVIDVLRQQPGLEVVQQGTIGQMASVFIRGARSESTLVLIDGMEANDAMSPAYGFDFAAMPAENIERIEVHLGPQSVRFGAGALGGVIHIITKSGQERSQINYLAETGSFATNRQFVSGSGKQGPISYALGASRITTRGFSAASESSGNTEPDGAKVLSSSLKLGWNPNRHSKLETVFNFTDTEVDIDSHGGFGGDDPNNHTHSRQFIVGLLGSSRFFSESLKSTIGLHFSEVDRASRNEPDFKNTNDSSDHFLSETRKIQSDHEWLIGEYHTLRFGLSWRDESGLSNSSLNGLAHDIQRKTQSVTGTSITHVFEGENWLTDLGIRLDRSSDRRNIPSFRATLGKPIKSHRTKLSASYGTGYKLPSLYQLYSFYGDENLKEEVSRTLEIMIEKRIFENSGFTVTGFSSQFQDLIDYNMATHRYYNLSRTTSLGFEAQARIFITNELNLKGSYTYSDTKDELTGLELVRRPRHSGLVSTQFDTSKYNLYIRQIFRGERSDIDPNSFQRVTNPADSITSVGVTYRLRSWAKVHARFENLFDRKYEEIAGYSSAGRSYYIGLSGDL